MKNKTVKDVFHSLIWKTKHKIYIEYDTFFSKTEYLFPILNLHLLICVDIIDGVVLSKLAGGLYTTSNKQQSGLINTNF